MGRVTSITAICCGMFIYSGSMGLAGHPVFAENGQGARQQDALPIRPQIIVDAKYDGLLQIKEGTPVYKTVGEALRKLDKRNEPITILIKPGTYREKLAISQPGLTLIGEDNERTLLVFDDAEGTLVRDADGGDGKKSYVMNCASVTILPSAKGFRAENLTFSNDFDTIHRRNTGMKAVQAFAVRNDADESGFWNCRFLGHQDTLYANTGRQYYYDCYIEGDVDFVFGGADAVYENCTINSLNKPGELKGYVTAPSTLADAKGYFFYHCHLTSNIPEKGTVKLGRPWHPSSQKLPVNSSALFKECIMDAHIASEAWSSMGNKYGVFQPEDNRLYEWGSTGAGAGINSKPRRNLADVEAAKYTVRFYLGGWRPEKPL
jgi:pectinesterase